MSSFKRANLATTVLAALIALHASSACAEDWAYRADLGGWLDNETGLVWGPNYADLTGVIVTWNGAQTSAMNNYTQITGFTGWQLPTLAEAQTAYDHNAFAYFQQNVSYADRSFWTSTESKNRKSAYRFFFKTGVAELVGKQSGLFMIAVRRP